MNKKWTNYLVLVSFTIILTSCAGGSGGDDGDGYYVKINDLKLTPTNTITNGITYTLTWDVDFRVVDANIFIGAYLQKGAEWQPGRDYFDVSGQIKDNRCYYETRPPTFPCDGTHSITFEYENGFTFARNNSEHDSIPDNVTRHHIEGDAYILLRAIATRSLHGDTDSDDYWIKDFKAIPVYVE